MLSDAIEREHTAKKSEYSAAGDRLLEADDAFDELITRVAHASEVLQAWDAQCSIDINAIDWPTIEEIKAAVGLVRNTYHEVHVAWDRIPRLRSSGRPEWQKGAESPATFLRTRHTRTTEQFYRPFVLTKSGLARLDETLRHFAGRVAYGFAYSDKLPPYDPLKYDKIIDRLGGFHADHLDDVYRSDESTGHRVTVCDITASAQHCYARLLLTDQLVVNDDDYADNRWNVRILTKGAEKPCNRLRRDVVLQLTESARSWVVSVANKLLGTRVARFQIWT